MLFLACPSGPSCWPQHRVEAAGAHACCKCGEVRELARGGAATRPVCQGKGWVPMCDTRREA